MSDIKLKPCPFCGSEAVLNDMTYCGKFMCDVVCTNDDCRVSLRGTRYIYNDRQSAIEAWNERFKNKKSIDYRKKLSRALTKIESCSMGKWYVGRTDGKPDEVVLLEDVEMIILGLLNEDTSHDD